MCCSLEIENRNLKVVAMVADMLGCGAGAVGSITSGGTESLLMTIKTYRDRARDLQPHITRPEVVSNKLQLFVYHFQKSSYQIAVV